MIDKIQEKIDKYEILENEADTFDIQRTIGEFLGDLNQLLKYAKEKKKACCEKKSGKQITVTACRNCPYFTLREIMNDYCSHPKEKEIGGHDITQHDIVPKWCPL